MKKIISLFFISIIIVFTVIICSLSVSAEQSGRVGTCTWTYDGSTLTVSGSGTVDLYGFITFKESVTSLVIEEGITAIAARSFECYSSLTDVSLPNSLTSIGAGAFSGCNSLVEITIPENVKYMEKDAFLLCRSLVNIFVDDSNTAYSDINGVLCSGDGMSLYQYPKAKPESLYVLPPEVRIISESAFEGALYLADIELHDDVIKIGFNAFSNTKIIYDSKNVFKGVIYLGDYLIRIQNKELSSCPIRVGTRIIADGAFVGATNLERVALCEGLTHIGKNAFNSCFKLKSIYLPQSLVSIGSGAFENCSALNEGCYGGLEEELEQLLNNSSNYQLKKFYWICRTDGSRVIKHIMQDYKVIKEATCSEYGIFVGICSQCLLEITRQQLPDSSKHIPVEWKETRVSTCTVQGEAESPCALCDELLKLSLPALGHKYGEWNFVSEATCSVGEIKTRTCSVCEHIEKSTTEAKGHIWGEQTILKHPTDKEIGMAISLCSVCGIAQSTELSMLPLAEENNFIGAVIGISVAALIAVALVITLIIVIKKRKKRNS